MKNRSVRTIILGVVSLAVGLTVAMAGGERSAVKNRAGLAGKGLVNQVALANEPSLRQASPRTQTRRTGPPTIEVREGPLVVAREFNGDLRSLPPVPDTPSITSDLEPLALGFSKPNTAAAAPPVPASAPNMPAADISFKGMSFNLNGAGFPPDTVGDVGPNHYIQAVNTSMAIYNKNGTVASAPITLNTLWAGAGTGTVCDNNHRGDPTVVYDPLRDRWVVADFAFTGNATTAPFYECIAASKTSNPVTGGWWLYAYRADDAQHPWFPDYPKMGIWDDGLYMMANVFDLNLCPCPPGVPNKGVRAYAFNVTDLYSGAVLRNAVVDVTDPNNEFFTLLPSNLRSGTLPPAGTPNYFAGESGFCCFGLNVFKFSFDEVTPSNSTFTGPTMVPHTSYNFTACCTVPSTVNSLDTLTDRGMMQLQYRNIGGAESLWFTHTVHTGATPGSWGVQWLQVNVSGGSINTTAVQQQIYTNVGSDGLHRWMPSLAVDKAGNMAIGYSVTNTSTPPQIRYSGRLIGDAANGLGQGEATLIAGAGSQSGICGTSTCTRWGDYSAMTVDPDGCRFWYTTEYYDVNGLDWQTRIGSFTYPDPGPQGGPGCHPGTPTAIGVARLTASRTKAGVRVSWRTESEAKMLGFNVWRSRSDGTWQKVNQALIAAKHSGARGGAYSFVDRTVLTGSPYTYRLQVVDISGKRTWYGAAVVSGVRAGTTR